MGPLTFLCPFGPVWDVAPRVGVKYSRLRESSHLILVAPVPEQGREMGRIELPLTFPLPSQLCPTKDSALSGSAGLSWALALKLWARSRQPRLRLSVKRAGRGC